MIIGLTGRKGSGKTTASKHLQQEYSFSPANFKDALVAEMLDRLPTVLLELKSVYDMSLDELFTKKPPVMRALMQNYGTEVRRGDDPNYWVKRWAEATKNIKGNIVVDDVRFINEAKAIKEAGGVIIRIVRHDQEDDADQHQSEQEQMVIRPDFTLYAGTDKHAELYRQLEQVLSEMKQNVD